MSEQNSSPTIPYYHSINDFLASFSRGYQTKDPNLYCLSINAQAGDTIDHAKPPYRKDFYFISLVTKAGKTSINFETESQTDLDSFLVLQAPGLPYSFYRDPSAEAYIVYFKKDCLHYFVPDFEQEFPFFNITHTHFYKLTQQKFKQIATGFIALFEAYQQFDSNTNRLPSVKLLSLLYELKTFTASFKDWENSFMSAGQLVLKRFVQLINIHYLEKRTVDEYAILLNLSPNHLSQTIKTASGKNALAHINDRILLEAKSLIRLTHLDISEIAFKLNFSDNANFGKFFKKNEGISPLEFRKMAHP
jgi:AraC family transcriptional regulator, transcriptional activator of pobA